MAIADWQPFTLTSLRWFFGLLILTPFAIGPLQRDWPLIRKHAVLMFALGGIGMAGFNLCMYLALNFTTAINVSIEQAAIPALIMLANFFVLSQRVRLWQGIGLLLTLFGVFITISEGVHGAFFTNGLNRGDALMLLGSLCYAAYTFGLRWRPAIHWMSFMWVIALSAFVMTLPFAGWELSQGEFTAPSLQGILILAYVAIFPTILSQLSWARGVELIGSNRAGLFINLVPIFGSAMAVVILREHFQWFHFLGLTLVLIGIALSERAADKQ